MFESMVAATAHNLPKAYAGEEPILLPTWNTLCPADFGDWRAAFLAMPQNSPRNVSWTPQGRWAHWTKLVIEWFFIKKVRKGVSKPWNEKAAMKKIKITKNQ